MTTFRETMSDDHRQCDVLFAAVETAVDAGLRVGFTVAPQRPRLPLDDASRMQLGRFFFHGGLDIRRQCRLFGARFAPSHAIKRMMQSA